MVFGLSGFRPTQRGEFETGAVLVIFALMRLVLLKQMKILIRKIENIFSDKICRKVKFRDFISSIF